MKHCPNCAAPFDGLVPFCWHCGRDAKEPVRPEPPEQTASDPLPTTAGAAPSVHQVTERSSDAEATRAEVAIAANPEGRRLSRWALAVAGVLAWSRDDDGRRPGGDRYAGAGESFTGRIQHVSRIQAVPQWPHPTRPALPADPEPIIESAPPPTWVGARRATWARDGSKTIAFELAASNDVGVWMKRVQPLLVVRCLSRTTEVFVATGSAASIEQQAGSHTVHIQFDDAEPVAQPWSDSVSSQELYAPDGVTLARRLARARTMRFGFTPYNSAPVVAEFDVSGFDQLVGLVAGTCGWRVDDSRPAEKRRAALELNASPRDQPDRPFHFPCSRLTGARVESQLSPSQRRALG